MSAKIKRGIIVKGKYKSKQTVLIPLADENKVIHLFHENLVLENYYLKLNIRKVYHLCNVIKLLNQTQNKQVQIRVDIRTIDC